MKGGHENSEGGQDEEEKKEIKDEREVKSRTS